jgi:hypothetical protein
LTAVHTQRLHAAVNEERATKRVTRAQHAAVLGCTAHQLTGLPTARFATDTELAMRITQSISRPAADYIDVDNW